MALFNRKPKLPSYVGMELDGLLQDPKWAYAIQEAGINPHDCEIVLRLSEAIVGRDPRGLPDHTTPAILFGQGEMLAVAFPGERDVMVVTKNKTRGTLQTQRSGWFQIVFGPAENLEGFMFWDSPDNLRLGTPEGENFGKIMSAFMAGQLSPGKVRGTPQSLVAQDGGGATVDSATPKFTGPEDELRWKLTFATHDAFAAMMDAYQKCFETAQGVEQAYGLANSAYVNGVQQHPVSREHFRQAAVDGERELSGKLADLRQVTAVAASRWQDLMFLFPNSDTIQQFADFHRWCVLAGVASETYSAVAVNAMFVHTDFGVTRDSFWAENERVLSVMNRSGQ